jgi:hypothetical protein
MPDLEAIIEDDDMTLDDLLQFIVDNHSKSSNYRFLRNLLSLYYNLDNKFAEELSESGNNIALDKIERLMVGLIKKRNENDKDKLLDLLNKIDSEAAIAQKKKNTWQKG